MPSNIQVAYFSMEIALHPAMPTYSGGLGVLAGDTMRAAADLELPLCAMTMVHRKGYFCQSLDRKGLQVEAQEEWNPGSFAQEMPQRVFVEIERRQVELRCWRYTVAGVTGAEVPVFLLDSNLPTNAPEDRELTDLLYGGDARYRLCQEAILGIAGVRMLRALGCENIARFHMNEGHAALLTVELLEEEARRVGRLAILQDDIAAVRARCVFTTHTPVPAGHDRFPIGLVKSVLGDGHPLFSSADLYCAIDTGGVISEPCLSHDELFDSDQRLNMTYLALNLSRYVNGVATKHAEVSQTMFGSSYAVDSITNGVHAANWVCPPFRELFDHHIAGWDKDNFGLRCARKIPLDAIKNAHRAAKDHLCSHVYERVGIQLDPTVLTLGFARRTTAYKRALLLLSDMDRLSEIAEQAGGLQILYAGKAHPNDTQGKEIIQRIWEISEDSEGKKLRIVFLPNYDLGLARVLIPGVDVWVNTPKAPLEASGTSGMKAALNGVPSLSVLDGWWIEGCIEGVTGWAADETESDSGDAASLLAKLSDAVVPLYRDDPDAFATVMRAAIALNGSFFNTQRMMLEYVVRAYVLGKSPRLTAGLEDH